MRKFLFSILFIVLMAFVVGACGTADDAPYTVHDHSTEDSVVDAGAADANGGEVETPVPGTAVGGDPLAAMDAVLARFPQSVNTGAEHVPGTTFRFAIPIASPWPGLFGGGIFHTSLDEDRINHLIGTSSSLFSVTEFMQFGQDGIVNWSLDTGANTLTLNMQHFPNWHDGVPLTLDDLVFAYEVIVHPDYDGIRRTPHIMNIVGAEEFNSGNADYISGMFLSNDNQTLTIHFYEMDPTLLYFGIWTSPMPRHIFEHIPVADMSSSPEVLVNPIGWGPFIVENIVPGESVHLRRNEDFVFGAPLIEDMVVERIAPELFPSAMEEGRFDFGQFSTLFYGDHQNPTNFTYLGSLTGAYTYLAFRVGNFDFDNNLNVFNPDRKMSNVHLRRAMAYATDESVLSELLFNGLQFPAANNIPAHHRLLMDLNVPGFPYDPARAMQTLDEAGFIDVTGDGFRDDPNGNELTIIWAFPTGPEEEVIVNFYIQQWAEVGLRVELWQGRTHDQVYLWDILDFDADNDEIDIYTGQWAPGFNPSPAESWGHAIWNPSRYTSPDYDDAIDRLSSYEAWDPAYMMIAYSNWQWYWYNNLPYFPQRWRIDLFAINNRVTRWDTDVQNTVIEGGGPTPDFGWHMIGLSAAEPYSR